jgi:hypothetical protein
MPSVGSGSRAADPMRIFLQVDRCGKPVLRLKCAGNTLAGTPVRIVRIDDNPAPCQLSPTTVL